MAELEPDVHVQAAIIAGGDSSMNRAANKLKANLIAEAVRHNLTGAFAQSFRIRKAPGLQSTGRQVTDRIVYSVDPAAMSINYGHIAGPRPHQEFQKVPGKHVFEKAINRTSG